MENSALYIQIFNKLSKEIKEGKYLHKKRLPSENMLAIQFNVSRVTIRQALKLLVEKNLIEIKKGSGSYIKYNNSGINEKSNHILSFKEEMSFSGYSSKTDIMAFEIKKAPDTIIEKLQLERDSKVYYFERIRYGNDKAFVIEYTYMPVKLFPNLTYNTLLQSKYEYIERTMGITISYSSQNVIAIPSTKSISNLFNIDLNTPITYICSTTFSDYGIPIDYTEMAINPSEYELHFIKWRPKK